MLTQRFKSMNYKAAQSRALIIDKINDKYFQEGRKILELGCGDGEFARSLRSTAPNLKRYVGCDINNLVLEYNVLDEYYLIDFESFGKILEEEKPDFVLIAYTLHHIVDDEVIKKYLNVIKSKGIRILVIEEIAVNPIYKQVLCINDLGNVLEYRSGINDRKEYFAFNFKSRKQWFSLFKKASYSPKLIGSVIRKFYIYCEMYELS